MPPTYEFQAADGSMIQRFLPISKAPPLGKKIKEKGKVYRRVISVPTLNAEQIATTVHGYPHVEYSLPKGDVGGGTDPDGRPIIKSQHHEQELIRQSEGRMRRD